MAFLNETGLKKFWDICTQKFLGKDDKVSAANITTTQGNKFVTNGENLNTSLDEILYSPLVFNSFYPQTRLTPQVFFEYDEDIEGFRFITSSFCNEDANSGNGLVLAGTNISPLTFYLAKNNAEDLPDTYKKAFSLTLDYNASDGTTVAVTLLNSGLTASEVLEGDVNPDIMLSTMMQKLFNNNSLATTMDAKFWVKILWGDNKQPLMEFSTN